MFGPADNQDGVGGGGGVGSVGGVGGGSAATGSDVGVGGTVGRSTAAARGAQHRDVAKIVERYEERKRVIVNEKDESDR